jgi:threonine/homoserine/homoserine lactone efflux protein
VTPEFLLTSLIVVATPGTGVIYTLAAGLARGTRASIVAAFGCTLGIAPHMVAAITGLAALLHASAVAFNVLKWAGGRLSPLPRLDDPEETGTLTAERATIPP